MKKEAVVITEDVVKQTLDLLISEKRFALGGFALKNLTVEKIHTLVGDTLLYSLHTLIPAENMKEETHIFNSEYPCDWKQAFKEQYFPVWLKKRYPVKYTLIKKTVKFTAYNLYPKFPAVFPERCKDAIQIIHKTVEEDEGERE